MSEISSLARLFCFAVITFGATGTVLAQEYPVKPIRMIVPNSAATNLDLMARIIAPEMAKTVGKPIIIENKPGASQMVGYEFVTKEPADGYTVAVVSVTALATLPITFKEMRFDPLKDLPPLIGVTEVRYLFGSSTKMPWTSFKDMAAQMKVNPGKYNYGSPAGYIQLLMEALLSSDLGLKVVHIPYSSGGAYTIALGEGEVHVGIIGESQAIAYGPKFQMLAVTGDQRLKTLPNAPTFAELGHPQIKGSGQSLNLRTGTPKVALDALYGAASNALQQPEVRAAFAKIYQDIAEQPSTVASKRLADEARFFADIAKAIGMTPK